MPAAPRRSPTWLGTRAARLYQCSIPLERDALEQALELAHPATEERLLDVASGTGALLRMLAARSTRPERAVGLDRSPGMLAVSRPLPGSWALVEGDARAMPFHDHSFDVIVLCYLLHLLRPRDRVRVLLEVRRVVRPGGRIVIVTVDAGSSVLRSVLRALPRWTGLRRIDLASELAATRLQPVRSCAVRRGWPSMCWLAEPTL
jgi:ubiquinone/menaquinone biosynthesis C-methylase UbiE